MLALAWQWDDAATNRPSLVQRLAASLCAGIGGHAGMASLNGVDFAYRPLRSTAAEARAWRPAVLRDGGLAVFHGYFDNARDIAAELGADAGDAQSLYGLAVDRWGDQADARIIGEYCAIIADPERQRLRLARSALRGPPLCYFHDDDLAAAASVPRALFAAGVEQRLNETRVVDSALLNFTDHEATWFEDVRRVPLGSVVDLRRGRSPVVRKYYDLHSLPDVRVASDSDCIARVSELLDEGVRACMAGFSHPGATLSGGLDSPQVAVRALANLPEGMRLPTFTFHPLPEFNGVDQFAKVGNERPFVEAFAAMHPRLETHFTANEGYGHDHRWTDFFHLMGGAPSGLCNMYVFHGLLDGAAKAGCDLLLLAEWGNYTFSDKGDWGYVEYLLTGRWRQLWLALTRPPNLTGSVAKQFLARTLSALLPDPIWRALRRLAFPNRKFLLELMRPLSAGYRRSTGGDQRLADAGIIGERYQPWSRRHAQRLLFHNLDADTAEIYQAFEQMYGVTLRDPTAYRPFVEYCFGLPVKMFMRDGELRWLAKQMAKGIMPEKQRANLVSGRWDPDWRLRIGRRQVEYAMELEQLAKDGRFAAMFDFPRLNHALKNLPDVNETDPQKYYSSEFAIPRALLTARFVNYVEGRNSLDTL